MKCIDIDLPGQALLVDGYLDGNMRIFEPWVTRWVWSDRAVISSVFIDASHRTKKLEQTSDHGREEEKSKR